MEPTFTEHYYVLSAQANSILFYLHHSYVRRCPPIPQMRAGNGGGGSCGFPRPQVAALHACSSLARAGLCHMGDPIIRTSLLLV